jgi:hypothetical protein
MLTLQVMNSRRRIDHIRRLIVRSEFCPATSSDRL